MSATRLEIDTHDQVLRLEASSRWTPLLVPAICGVIGVALLRGVNPDDSGPYGLISALPALLFVPVVVLGASFLVTLRRTPERQDVLLGHVVALIFILYGAGPLSEHEARGATTWLHAGFIDQILTTGRVLRGTDARFAWPGFFSGVATLLGPAGLTSARPLLLWAPVVSALVYIIPLVAIGRALVESLRVRWLAIWLFFLTDWTSQEYFSPQGACFFLFLCFMAIVLTYGRGSAFGLTLPSPAPAHSVGRRFQPSRRVRNWLASRAATEKLDPGATEPVQRVAVLVALAFLAAAMVVSHQLTPVALFLDLAALAVIGRLLYRGLPVLVGLITGGFVSFMASDFWSGHLGDLTGTGSSGSGGAVQAGLATRFAGTDQAHLRVVYLRAGFALGLWLLASIGVLRRIKRKRLDLTTIVVAVVPLSIPFVQSYGGEGLVRAFLYSLPFMTILGALALLPSHAPRLRNYVAVGLVTALLIPMFLIAKYGNEVYERVRPGEVAAMEYLYGHAPEGSMILVAIDNLPWRYEHYNSYQYYVIPVAITQQSVIAALRQAPREGAYFVLSTGQEEYGRINYGLKPGWTGTLTKRLTARADMRIVMRNDDAVVFQYRAAAVSS